MMVRPSSIAFKSIQSVLLIFVWSLFQVEGMADSKIIVSEIYYNPNGPDEAREFIEIKNVGDLAADISGWQFTNGVNYTFPNQTFLDPGEFYVIVANAEFFATQYPQVVIGGQYIDDDGAGAGRAGLSNRGERITLKDGPDDTGNTIYSFRYYDGDGGDIPDPPELPEDDDLERASWPSATDGGDYSLVHIKPDGSLDEDDFESWRPSISMHGSPGADEPLPDPLLPIYINEVRTRDGDLDNDAIEIYNPNATDIDVSGWYVSDNIDRPTKNPPIADNSIVPAGGYLVLENGINGFVISVSSKGERVFIYSAEDSVLTGWVHGSHFPATEDGKNFARFLDFSGNEFFIPDEPSLGVENGDPSASGLKIIEIMYTPGYGSSVEYVKIINNGPQEAILYDPLFDGDNLSLNGFGVTVPGDQPTMAVGEVAFITNVEESLFRKAYDVDASVRIFGDTEGGSLNGGGELLELRIPITIEGLQRDAPGHPRYYAILDSVEYDDEFPWPVAADGLGYSLIRNNSLGPGYRAADWNASSHRGGTAFGGGAVLINEILSHTDLPQTDVIELYNPSSEDIEIGGWYLTDDPLLQPKKYIIPNGTVISSGGYWAVNEDNNADPGAPPNYFGTSFSISSRGDEVFVFSANSEGDLTGFSHGAKFGATQNGVSIIRYINGVGIEKFVPQSGSPSFEINRFEAFPDGYSNNPPLIERAVISEISYEPSEGGIEYIEISNISGTALPLYDTTPVNLGGDPSNNWSLDGIVFTFPGNEPELQPGERVVIIPKGIPVSDFRNQYNVPNGVIVYGADNGFSGALNNGGEKIKLLRPDKPDFVPGVGIIVPMIEVDSVDYDDIAPWPLGSGRSIERIVESNFGDDATNWQASIDPLGSPGKENSVISSGYDDWSQLEFSEEELQGDGTGPEDDFDGDGIINLHEYAFGLSPKDVAPQESLPRIDFVENNGFQSSAILFQKLAGANDVDITVQRSNDMLSWTVINEGVAVDNEDGTMNMIYYDSMDSGDGKVFFRLVVELVVP
jgi:hypothetical protein